MTIACIMQPTYLPWLGYLDLIDQADVFVLDDLAAISTKSWQTRNRILARDGNVVWLSVPTHAYQGQPLNEVKIAADFDWQRKHWRILEMAYAGTRGWPALSLLARFYDRDYYRPKRLTELTERTLRAITTILGIETSIVRASTMPPLALGRLERLADILACVDADELLDTAGARSVLGVDAIDGVPIRWHDYKHPIYDQGRQTFVSHLSSVDAIARLSPERAIKLIRTGRAIRA